MHSFFSWINCRLRGRVELELEVIALRHQLAVLRRQRPGRAQLSSIDRLIRVWLYRLWPRFLKVMVVVKPATVIRFWYCCPAILPVPSVTGLSCLQVIRISK